MSIFKRLKNLWEISAFELPQKGKEPGIGTTVVTALYKNPIDRSQATIIKLKQADPIEEALKAINE